MKKILALLLALVMCLAVLTSCDAVTGVIDQIKDKIDGIINPQPPVEYHIDKAQSFLNNMYKNENPVTPADYEVVGQVRVAGVVYTVTWATDVADVKVEALENGNYLINIDENAASEYNYVLTATITAGNGETATLSFNRTVPEKNLFVSVGTPVEGTAYKFFMIQVAEGNKVLYANGTTDNDKYLKTTQVGKDAPDFYVEKSGEGFKFYFVKGEAKMYIKAYLTTTDNTKFSKCLMYTNNTDEATVWTYDAATNSWQTSLVQNTLEGDKTVDYVIGTYGTFLTFSISESSYITPDNTGKTQFPAGLLPKEVAEMDNSTPEEKVAAELAEIAVPTNVKVDGLLDLPLVGSRYPEVTMTWTSNSEYAVVGEDGKITITVPAEPVTVKLTVVVAFGEVSETKEFEVELSREATPIADIIALAKTLEDKGATTTDKYIVAGVVVELKNTQYGNLYIQDDAGNRLYVYGLYDQANVRYDKMENAPQVGDYVVLLSVVGHYNEPQLKNATVLSCVSATSIPEANEIAKTLEDKGPTTEEKYLISGKVVEVANTQYGNLYIEDEAGNRMYVYGLYDSANNRYDKMPVQPKVGDTITVLSVIGHYNNPQLKNATVVCYTAGTVEEPVHECESVCATCGKCTDAACEESVCAEKCEGHEPAVEEPEVSNTVELTVNSLGLADQSYSAGTATVNGVAFEFVQLGNYGDGIQMRDSSKGTSILWNTSAFGSAIVRIDLVYSGTKDVTHSNPDAVIFSFGTSVDNLTYTTKLSTTAGTKTYSITPDAESYTFFKLEHDLGYSMYWESITFVLADGTTVNPNPNPNPDPVHTCESKCDTCGKCTDAACTESVCAEKCEGHEVVAPSGVVDPVVGTAYAFGMVQGNVGKTYYLKGGMNGFYMDTTENIADSLHVYIEETTGGYYLYCFVGTTKTYINCVVSGTHVNGAYEATASTVYTYDAESKTLIADVDGTPYWFGTRNDKTYTTVGPCAVSYKGFYCQFYAVEGTETPGEPPVVPAHECESKCDTCGKCTDATCTESVCAEKCEGHETNTEVALYEYTMKSGDFSANGTKKLGDLEWTLDGNGGYWGFDSQYGRGHQFGSSKASYSEMTFTSESVANVTKIVINTCGAKDIAGNLVVTVGGVVVEEIKLTNVSTDYTIELDEAMTGEIVFTYTQTSSKALYIKSISIYTAE